jgi:prolyl-tRNA editing enzyme YbaK/EbsC (Cys-tRNA(Pro) deacylase)
MTALAWRPALEHPDLLAAGTLAALTAWAQVAPLVAEQVLVAPIDPDLADTAALVEAYGLDPGACVNCVLVVGRRDGSERLAAAGVRATTRADVNNRVKRLLDVHKASFLATERAVDLSGMEYGGITLIGLPSQFRVLLDARVDDDAQVIIGSGLRRSKLALPGSLLAKGPGVEVVEGLATG